MHHTVLPDVDLSFSGDLSTNYSLFNCVNAMQSQGEAPSPVQHRLLAGLLSTITTASMALACPAQAEVLPFLSSTGTTPLTLILQLSHMAHLEYHVKSPCERLGLVNKNHASQFLLVAVAGH